jgi:hypothetical protein
MNLTLGSTDKGRMYVSAPTLLIAFLVIAGLVASNASLLVKNRRYKSLIEAEEASKLPTLGTHVPPLHGVGLDGQPISIYYGEDTRKTLLFIFSPDCGACALNWPVWASTEHIADHTLFRFVYANIGGRFQPDYLRQKGLDSSDLVIAEVDPNYILKYNLNFTPETILVGSDGRIESVWAGLIQGDDLLSFKHSLNIENSVSISRPWTICPGPGLKRCALGVPNVSARSTQTIKEEFRPWSD